MPPTNALMEAINVMKSGKEDAEVRTNRMLIGISFCQVDKIRHMDQGRLAITLGNQKWHGGTPSLTKTPIVIIKFAMSKGRAKAGATDREAAPRRISPEPRAWAKKYFTAPSVS